MKFKTVLSLLLAAVFTLCLAPFSAIRASASAEPTIKVGFFAFDGYHIVDDETGRRSGYGYEFLQLLARHTDWQYEYVGYEKSYAEALEMLERGEVDVVTSVSKTPEREELFLFSEKDIGTNSTIFTVKAGNTKIVKGDYSTYEGLRIGMLEGNSKNAAFESFAEGKFSFTPVYYQQEDDLSDALSRGEVDGIVSGSLRAMGSEWLMESLSASPFYICVRKDKTELMQTINDAIDELDLQQPDWRNVLQDKYYSTDQNGNIVVSSEERDFLLSLQGKEPLQILMNPDRAPYSYFKDGKAEGILPALFEKMTETLSLAYEFYPVKDRAEYYQMRDSGEADIVLDFTDDLYLSENSGYKITDVYYSSTHTLLKRRDLKGNPKRFATIKYVDNMYSNYLDKYVGADTTVKQYNSLEESIEAVKNGECDATIALSYVAELYIWQDTKNDLISELISEAATDYAIGVNGSRYGHVLLSILNKCVTGLDRAAAAGIVSEQVAVFRPEGDGGLLTFLRRNPIYIVFLVSGVLLLLFAIAMLIVRSLNQRKLQRRVEEATSKLKAQTEELSVALHAADAANRSKTTFLNNMSHDIRTPMNAIIGFTALASTHIDNRERALDYLTKISQASNHLLSLINDVLDMSRIESGKVHIEERPENLADILQGLRNIIQSDIHAKNLELFIDTVDVTHEDVYCDKLRLNQILLNLTSNAIKFTKSGGSVFIKITQKPCDKENFGLYEFSVSDTGIGMSPEFVKNVFDPFTRERNSTVSGIQGTGLGMAITKNIVDMMGGEISVKSEQGKGSEFVVKLTLKFADSEPQEISFPELSGMYSLVVDDDLVSCQSVAKMLRGIGMHAEWTVTGKEAIVRTTEAIELGHPFEVYIVDWSMPDMDGIATVRQIRAIIGDDSPIILMSAYDWADIEQEAREAGVTGFLGKPLFASDLHRALERSLKRAPTPQAPQKEEPTFTGKRLLLVEDNELNREIAEEILSEAGFAVECAENGKIACEKVAASEAGYFDLILMDVQMPIMDGYEASRHIRAMSDPALASIPIIAMTANAFEEDRETAFAAGMNGHLAKPINVEKLLSLLDTVLNGNKPQDSAQDDKQSDE